VDPFSVTRLTPQNKALEVDGDNVAGAALRTNNQLCDAADAPDGERESLSTGDDLQPIPTPTTLRNRSPQSFPGHRPWGLGRGMGVRRNGAKKLT